MRAAPRTASSGHVGDIRVDPLAVLRGAMFHVKRTDRYPARLRVLVSHEWAPRVRAYVEVRAGWIGRRGLMGSGGSLDLGVSHPNSLIRSGGRYDIKADHSYPRTDSLGARPGIADSA